MATTYPAIPAAAPLRLKRARLTAKLAKRMGGIGLDWMAGFQRTYPSLEAARQAAAAYLPYDHSHPDNVSLHLALAETLRPSDYPVLYHLQNISNIRTVFDLGGNVGNLYYSYLQHLPALSETRWTVCDLPFVTSLGETMAESRNAHNLAFVNSLGLLHQADVFLASGSIHYFEDTVPQMLERQDCRPHHVLINRTPLLLHRSTYTVQDAGTFLAACKMHSRAEIVSGMESLGYSLADEWSAPELSLIIPGHPELSAPSYSGLYFRLT